MGKIEDRTMIQMNVERDGIDLYLLYGKVNMVAMILLSDALESTDGQSTRLILALGEVCEKLKNVA